MLATQGVVELSLHRGARIAEIGEDRIANVRTVRTAIECAAFAKAAARLQAESESRTLSHLDAIIEAMKRAEQQSDLPTLNHLDIAFHRTIVTAAADPFLTALWEAQALHLQIVFAREVRALPRPVPYASVHLAIRYALIESSAAALRDLVARHIAGQSQIDLPLSSRPNHTNQNKNRRKP
jgi:DNA-binding GntR family transcriptional regulator